MYIELEYVIFSSCNTQKWMTLLHQSDNMNVSSKLNYGEYQRVDSLDITAHVRTIVYEILFGERFMAKKWSRARLSGETSDSHWFIFTL